MKKYFNLFAIALLALVAVSFSSCSKDDDDSKSAPTEFKFEAPCTNWDYSLDQVRDFMKKMSYTEGEAYNATGGKGMVYPYVNKECNITYSYTFEEGKLVSCSVNYDGMNENFDKFKGQVTSTYGVEEWKKETYGSDVMDWWTTTLKGKKTKISIGKSANYGGYMYVDLQYTEFDR